jgi:catechol 2,3-dioxygenase-like lactoylglutathione lyase family enzyme
MSEAVSPKGLAPHITGLAHVGYVVSDLRAAIDECARVYGLDEQAIRVVPPFSDAKAATRFAFVRVNNTLEFEFIEAISEQFKKLLHRSASGPAGINHMAYWVADIDAAERDLRAQGIRPGHVTPEGVVNTGSSRMLYLNPEDTGGALIELIERLDA